MKHVYWSSTCIRPCSATVALDHSSPLSYSDTQLWPKGLMSHMVVAWLFSTMLNLSHATKKSCLCMLSVASLLFVCCIKTWMMAICLIRLENSSLILSLFFRSGVVHGLTVLDMQESLKRELCWFKAASSVLLWLLCCSSVVLRHGWWPVFPWSWRIDHRFCQPPLEVGLCRS